jgi:hypothetical protein
MDKCLEATQASRALVSEQAKFREYVPEKPRSWWDKKKGTCGFERLAADPQRPLETSVEAKDDERVRQAKLRSAAP